MKEGTILTIIIILLVIVASFVVTRGVGYLLFTEEYGLDKYCIVMYGDDFVSGSIREVIGYNKCVAIIGDKELKEYYFTDAQYKKACDIPKFFNITDWKVECTKPEGGR